MKEFGEILRDLRKASNLTTIQLAKKINVSDSTISNWENNVYDVKGEHLKRLSKFFNVSTDYLLGLED